MVLPLGDGSAVTPPGPMPPLYPAAPPQSSFSGLVGKKKCDETQQIKLVRFELNTSVQKTWRSDVPKFLSLEMSTRGLTEHVALQLAPKPHGNGWHQPCCLLQAAWLDQRCLSAARGARHQAKAIALPLTPPSHPLSSLQHPPASSFHLYEGLEQPHENKALRRLDKSSCKPG